MTSQSQPVTEHASSEAATQAIAPSADLDVLILRAEQTAEIAKTGKMGALTQPYAAIVMLAAAQQLRALRAENEKLRPALQTAPTPAVASEVCASGVAPGTPKTPSENTNAV